jgi:hypothetical protein
MRDIGLQIAFTSHPNAGIINSMNALKEIRQMPFREKLLMMEAIWDDISREEENLEVPQWHKDVLDERERLVTEGKAQFLEWEDAKRQIREASQ